MKGMTTGRATGDRRPPLISIIIPTFNIDNYLDDCLDSITDQSFRNFEVIVVDGGSTDCSREVLDKRSGEDAGLIVIYERRIGPGAARNVGVERASGDYIWFVDGDDLIAADCLAVIAQRIEELRPEVLFIDHDFLYPDGARKPGDDHRLMREAPTQGFTFMEAPWVINLSMVSWNKVIRREFLQAVGATFSEGWPHEDIPVSCSLLPEARRLAALNTVACYYYRQRPGSEMRLNGGLKRHYNVFASYEAVLDQAKKRVANHDPVVTEEIYGAYFSRAIRHYAAVFDQRIFSSRNAGGSKGCARAECREYFEKMHFDYVHYRPSGYHLDHSAQAMKFRLIERNAFRRYVMLTPINRVRVKVKSAVGVIADGLSRHRSGGIGDGGVIVPDAGTVTASDVGTGTEAGGPGGAACSCD